MLRSARQLAKVGEDEYELARLTAVEMRKMSHMTCLRHQDVGIWIDIRVVFR